MVKKRACVFISGNGSNLREIIKSSRDPNFPIKINLVISNNKKAFGIKYAKIFSIPYVILNQKMNKFERKTLKLLVENKIELICLAGFMKILSKNFLREFKGKIINIHPSLLPKYKGLNTFKKAIKNKDKFTGCTVHYVNEKLDGGKIILKKRIEIKSNIEEMVKKSVQLQEYKAYSIAIRKIYNKN
ncbi:MAG: phosphoribosylglycinamide formyltransferase [Candidatus Marinimicrobia bacterium]|nr:phosphoribosylglycinamide formyltransferase [Candidatus Neomarinimicrobiota bacterium]|tara:strand:- start:456 stop:1016 length:561 start_codon:yes stop_codon:yes gene_type:complete